MALKQRYLPPDPDTKKSYTEDDSKPGEADGANESGETHKEGDVGGDGDGVKGGDDEGAKGGDDGAKGADDAVKGGDEEGEKRGDDGDATESTPTANPDVTNGNGEIKAGSKEGEWQLYARTFD